MIAIMVLMGGVSTAFLLTGFWLWCRSFSRHMESVLYHHAQEVISGEQLSFAYVQQERKQHLPQQPRLL